MRARWLLNVFLLVAVTLAGAVLLFKPRTPSAPSFRLVPAPAAELKEIEIVRGAQAPIVLVRAGNEWRMREPVAARLDQTSLARLLELTRVEVSSRLAATDLARYELDKPWARIRFNEHRIDFGMTNAVTNELYTQSGRQVLAIPARYAAAVPGTATRLLAHRMFAGEETPVAFRLAGFSLVHDGLRWHLAPPDPGLSQDDLVRWVDQWRLASSTATQPGSAPAGSEKIVIELNGARSIPFSIVARTPDLVLRREDEGLDYHFPARMATLLLAPPSAAASGKP